MRVAELRDELLNTLSIFTQGFENRKKVAA
jgi:hypothetical protein